MTSLLPTAKHEAEVRGRFDQLHSRFKSEVTPEDIRLDALRCAFGTIQSGRILDLGCGKGRFASRLIEGGASVVGLDLSSAMLAEAKGLNRVRASALRLPFRDEVFDGVAAVEVFEHLPSVRTALAEVRRVLKPGGVVAIVDKNAWSLNATRPWLPNLAIKWIDTRRGRWMYPNNGPVHERWFRPGALARGLATAGFEDVRMACLLSPEEARSPFFRRIPYARLFTLWTARVSGLAGGECL
jgi:ubiquinone/menaquinone biosynthesis C-methylase UbiE